MTNKLKVSVVDLPFVVESWDVPGDNVMSGGEVLCAKTQTQVSGHSIDGNRTMQIIVKSGNESDDAKLICDVLNDSLHLFPKTPKQKESMLMDLSDDISDNPYQPLSVDTYIDYGLMGLSREYPEFSKNTTEENHTYARWVLNYFRMSAIMKSDFASIMENDKLFADYEGKRYRVTGASRFGDVWLHSNPEVSVGYEHRVALDKLVNLSKDQ